MPANQKNTKFLPIIYRPYIFPQAFPVLAFLGDNWKTKRQCPNHLHFHNAIEIGCCNKGDGIIYINEQTFPFEAGDYSLIYSDALHATVFKSEKCSWEYLFFSPTLFFQPEVLCLLQCTLPSLQRNPIIKEETSPFLHFLLKQIFREVREKPPIYQDCVHGLLLSALSEYVNDPTSSISIHPDNYIAVIQLAFSYIRSNYAKPVDIPNMAEFCHLSEGHFRRIFKSITGLSPLSYIHQFRIQTACRLIYANAESFHSIAFQVGYCSLSSFNRQFLKFMQMSPREWKQMSLPRVSSNEIFSWTDLSHVISPFASSEHLDLDMVP